MFDFLSKKFASIFESFGKEKTFNSQNMSSALQSIEDALLESDVPHAVVQTFIESVNQELQGQKITHNLKPDEQLIRVVHKKLVAFLGGDQSCTFSFQYPSVVMVMGLQGSGKTTTVAKLAYHALTQARKKNKTRSVLVASVDFYRPAAIDQLEVLAHKVGCDFYRAGATTVVEAALEIYEYYKSGRYELLLLDTAGRLHVDEKMLNELKRIDQKLQPKHKLLVLDAMTGQESLAVAKSFDELVGFQAAILTKMDSEARGGAAFAFRYALKKPIVYLGFGEKIEDLQDFYPDRIAQRMLSMGDIQTLMERADEKIKKSEQDAMNSAFISGQFTLENFASQIDMVGRLGSFSQLVQYMPGMAASLSQTQILAGQTELKKIRAIISSMTPKERRNTTLIDDSRKKRIAIGAGVKPEDIGMLLQRFEQAQQYVKLLKKTGPFKGLFR